MLYGLEHKLRLGLRDFRYVLRLEFAFSPREGGGAVEFRLCVTTVGSLQAVACGHAFATFAPELTSRLVGWAEVLSKGLRTGRPQVPATQQLQKMSSCWGSPLLTT